MAIRTVSLTDLTVVLRKGFGPYTDSTGALRADEHGQPIFVADAVVPGRINGRFSTDNDRPETVRLRVVGANPGHGDGAIVRLAGKVTATVWYQARQRGNVARSALTITAEKVEAAHNEQPLVRGGLPTVLPAGLFLGQDANGAVDFMLPPTGSYQVEGLAELICTTAVSPELVGQEVTPVGVRTFFIAPDREDVSARSKAELVITCVGFERLTASNGRQRRSEPETAVEA